MNFVPLTSGNTTEWDRLVIESDEAWLYHLSDWLDLTERVWNVEPKSFLVTHEDEIVGIVPLQMNKRSKVLKSVVMGPAGVALKNDLTADLRGRLLKAIYLHIEEIAKENNSPSVEIYVSPLTEHSLNDRWQVNPLMNFGYQDISTQSFMIDLSRSTDEIESNFSKNVNEETKRAIKFGYTISEASGMDDYYEVHTETYARTGAPAHPKAYFTEIFDRICRKGHAKVWQALDRDGKPVAFELVALFKGKALYWSGCCKTVALDLGVNYLLQEHSILWSKAQGARWYESGEAFPGVREGKLQGLTMFKGKFGGGMHRFFKGKLELIKPCSRKQSLFSKLFKRCCRSC